ncbi:hypothetical protein DFJ77DRAFT_510503 [Powellomyces hirtus]|nr:hypothetical protein DFJ77DRAFT_510503 [Powellomyces hirtus]
MSHIDSEDDLPLSPAGSTSSGLPTSYYERYTRNYNLGERQRQKEQEEEARRRQREALRARDEQRNYGGSRPGTSSVATSDHLESAVENLYKMVERKVSSDQPDSARYPSPASSSQTRPSRPSRPESWTSTAIHSEVSKLYHMGAATSGPHRGMQADERGYPPQNDRNTPGGSAVSTLWRNGRSVTLENADPSKPRRAESGISCDLLLFIYGFLFPPLWWVGALRSEPTKYRKWSRIMAVVGTLLYLAAIAVLVWFFVFREK